MRDKRTRTAVPDDKKCLLFSSGGSVAKVCAQIRIYYGTRMSFSFVDTDDDSGDIM